MSEADPLNRVFFALSDPTRRNMLSRLVAADFAVGELAENYDVSLPAISKHLQVLQDAELVSVTKEGRTRYVRINTDGLADAQIWLSTINDEDTLFDNLESEIERMIEDLE